MNKFYFILIIVLYQMRGSFILKEKIGEKVIIFIFKKMNYEVQAYLANCEAYLMTPDNIEPNQLAQYILSYSNYGINDQITSLIQRYFYFNLNHCELLRYIQLLDRLIKYSFPLPFSFVKMYAQCFSQSVQNGRRVIQEELKILRKIWTLYLNHNMIETLRTQVYQITRIDIDRDLRDQSKKFLQQYFLKNFIPSNQINQILYKTSPIRLPAPQPLGRITQNVPQCPERDRKKHKQSEETESEIRQKEERKQISNREKAWLILNKLRNINDYSCRECGKHMQTQKAYEDHKQQHFEQRMKNLKQKRAKQSLKSMKINRKNTKLELKVQQWTKSNQISMSLTQSNLTIGIGQELGMSKECTFCSRQFDINIIDDSFVYKDTIRVSIQNGSQREEHSSQGSVDLMHTYCYKQLISSSFQ